MKLVRVLHRVTDYFYSFFTGQKFVERDGELHILDGDKVWLISDLHFGHKGIIPWCRADSFITINEMHRVLIKNWNSLIGSGDRILCVGDFGRLKFRSHLKGHITMIQGNHDKRQWIQQHILWYKDTKFLVVHDPDTANSECKDGWIIHGHSHRMAPFVDIHKKRVNVSCEVLGYRPISMKQLYTIIKESKRSTGNRWEVEKVLNCRR